MKIRGKFDVDLKTMENHIPQRDDTLFGRMTIAKTFYGPLSGTSCGEMLSARITGSGSAGYVAIEDIKATLDGRQGGFVVQHFGLMDAASQIQRLEVIPASGYGELSGISGSMRISVVDGEHIYEFEYELS